MAWSKRNAKRRAARRVDTVRSYESTTTVTAQDGSQRSWSTRATCSRFGRYTVEHLGAEPPFEMPDLSGEHIPTIFIDDDGKYHLAG